MFSFRVTINLNWAFSKGETGSLSIQTKILNLFCITHLDHR